MEHIGKGIVILDGASGTTLQKRGMKPGDCPEQWASEHPEEVIAMQKDYIEAGSQAVYTFYSWWQCGQVKRVMALRMYMASIKNWLRFPLPLRKARPFVGGDVGIYRPFL